MPATHANFYLPISDRLLTPVLDDTEDFGNALAALDVPQIAALVLLQYLPKLKSGSSLSPDRILLETIRAGNAQVQRAGRPALMADAVKRLDRARIQEGCELLPNFGIALLEEELLTRRGYLTGDGQWDSGFRERQRIRSSESSARIVSPTKRPGILTQEQSRIFREVAAQTDDHMHVQGYAGSGKSYLIKSLLAMLDQAGAQVIVLAERQRQLLSLLSGVDRTERVHPRRFDSLVDEIIPSSAGRVARRMRYTNFSSAPISDDAVIRQLQIRRSGDFTARAIVRAVRSTVAGFCYGEDRDIEEEHIPNWCASTFDAATKQVVLHHASQLWAAILDPPSRDFRPPVRGYHRIKWVALNGWTIPGSYTHILIDECHDLAKSMLQILDRSPQAVISLGDEYQNLRGRPQRRSIDVRLRIVAQSVRSGRLVEAVVNPIITAHPGKTKAPFLGNPLNKTEIEYYDKPTVPDRAAVILVDDTWGLFEWAQRLAAENLDMELLTSRAQLSLFVSDCVELYRNGTRPRHGDLFRFNSWDAVAKHHHSNHGFRRIDRLLAKQYSMEDWSRTAARFVKSPGSGYALGRIEDVRNREFDTIMLAPEVVDRALEDPSALGEAGSAIYVAITRAHRRVIVPQRLRDWIDELTARQKQMIAPTRAPA